MKLTQIRNFKDFPCRSILTLLVARIVDEVVGEPDGEGRSGDDRPSDARGQGGVAHGAVGERDDLKVV